VTDSIVPWVIRWEEEINRALLISKLSGVFAKLDLKGLLRGAFKDRQEGLQIMRRNGVINAAEWRDLEDMGPMSGEGGELYVIEQNMQALDRVRDASAPPEQSGAALNAHLRLLKAIASE